MLGRCSLWFQDTSADVRWLTFPPNLVALVSQGCTIIKQQKGPFNHLYTLQTADVISDGIPTLFDQGLAYPHATDEALPLHTREALLHVVSRGCMLDRIHGLGLLRNCFQQLLHQARAFDSATSSTFFERPIPKYTAWTVSYKP